MQLSQVVLGRWFLVIVMFSNLGTEVSGYQETSGECTRLERQLHTRVVSYRETYKKRVMGIFWRTATRINYRIEHVYKYVTVSECCPGYDRMPTESYILSCVPRCPRGCPGGKCIQPNICECYTGHRHPSPQNLSFCQYFCDPNTDDLSCGGHGRCINAWQCSCDEGYIETIHYERKAVTCDPKCKPACGLHGFCHEPNKCRCDTGYRLALPNEHSELQECEPICENVCINGVCQSPNKCSCLPGYKQHPTKYFLCEPVCNYDCINANCTKPDHCECHVGYEKSESNSVGTCSPICDQKCVNGACTRPNHCECHLGYEIIPNFSNSTCVPICNLPCINATCTQPDTCECYIGYRKNPDGPDNECSPLCDPPCINGECTKPDHCECHNRYKTDPDHPEVCIPVCDPPCTNAVCIQPDTCECLNGYKKSTDEQPQMCSPICNSPCVNGYCYEPNLCRCNDGYTNLPTDSPQFCTPVCDPACDSNGFCESPNKCSCNDGYIEADSIANSTFKNSFICQPFCSSGCNENASCVSPNLCRCNPGYQPVFSTVQASNPTACLPICEKDCLRGFCGYPNECVCNLGYKISQIDKFQCEPHCQQDCINAKCTRPNHCECFDGYEKAPFEQTESSDNLSILNNICIPHCSENCSNCIAPNQCLACHSGYVLKDSVTNPSSLSCQPLCEPACPHGLECILPNQCQFSIEYDQNDNGFSTTETDVFNSTKDCPDGGYFIKENETCICKTGWIGSGCDEPIFCIMRLTADNETDNQFYTTLSDAIENNEMNNEAAYEEADRMLDQQAPNCNEDCRNSILELDINNVTDRIMHCHREMYSNAVNDSVTTEDPLLNADKNNTSIVCFIKAESKCSRPKTQVTLVSGSLSGVSGAIGSGVFVITLTLVGLISFIIFQKRRNAKVVSRSTSILTGWTDNPDHHRNPETSTL